MQKAFEKIVERLEEINFNDIQVSVSRVLEKYGFPRECVVQDEVWDELDGLCTIQPAIEIVNQVAEEYKPKTNADIQKVIDNLELYTVGRLKTARVNMTVKELQNQIDRLEQLAEEYKQEVCEWKQCGEYLRPYQTTSCEKFALHDISYVYCPYCGKRIKVVE